MPLTRRKQKRFKLETEITAQIVDQNGNPVGSALYGSLQDISVGGACFTVQNSSRDFIRTLPQKMTTLTFSFEKGTPVTVSGLIVGAKIGLSSSCTINLEFNQQYIDERLNKLIDICQKLKGANGSEALQKESEGEAKESLTKAKIDLASLANLMDELTRVQRELAKDKQSPKALDEAKKSVGEIRGSTQKPAGAQTGAGGEAPPQKPMPSHKKIAALTRAIEKDPRDARLIQKLVDLYISFELYEAAIKTLKAVLKFNPKVAELQYLLGDTYYKAERFQESLAPFNRAIRLNPKLAKAHYFLSIVNELVGKEESAQKHYQTAIALDPDVESGV